MMLELRLLELLREHPLREFVKIEQNVGSWPKWAITLLSPYGVTAKGRDVYFDYRYEANTVNTSVRIEGLPTVTSEVRGPKPQEKTICSVLAHVAFALQSSVIPSLYCAHIRIALDIARNDLSDDGAGGECAAEALLNQIVFFYYVQWFERNNLRYCLGMGAQGFALPHIAHRKFYSDRIGDYASDEHMPLFLGASFRHMGVHRHIVDYLLGEGEAAPDIELLRPYLPRVGLPEKTVLNMSFGKESLFVYELLNRSPKLFTFSHSQDKTDYEQRASALDSTARHLVCNYLPAILDPVGNQLLPGAPIHTLFIPNMMAQCTSLNSDEFSHILFGDEFERSVSQTQVNFGDGRTETVFTYDFNQTPRFAAAFNACKPADWPAIGSVMYNLTGLQAQMLFDATGSNILQTSCHSSLATGKNCGTCAKCHRVGVRKKVVGTMANADYDISWKAALDTCAWTLLEYYGHGENYGANWHLAIQHEGMQAISKVKAGLATEISSTVFGDFWESMATLIDDLPDMLPLKQVAALKYQLAEVAWTRKKVMELELLR